MTVTEARAAMTGLDLPYLQRVIDRAGAAKALLVGLVLATILEDRHVTRDEALELAVILYLLAQIEREGAGLAQVTNVAANAVVPIAAQEGANQAAALLRGTFDLGPVAKPFVTPAALQSGNAIRTGVLSGFGADAVTTFTDKLMAGLERLGLRSAALQAIDETFGADIGGTVGTMTRRGMIVVRQSNYDTFRPAMIETYRLNLDDANYWVWKSRLDGRVCAACAALHGKTFPLSRGFEHAHTGCRCMPVIIASKRDAGSSGDDWLRAQDAKTQRAVLGKRGADLYQAGALELRDFLRLQRHPVYGPSYRNGGVGWAERKAARRAAPGGG